jgi:hypothetical protein
MPAVTHPDWIAAAERYPVGPLPLSWSPGAVRLAEASIERHGLLLLGEFHGVAENPLIAETVAAALQLDTIAFEWPASSIDQVLEDPVAWCGDGRVTAGHLALVRRTRCRIVGVDTAWGAERDAAMASAVGALPGYTLFVAGNIHTRLDGYRGSATTGSILASTRPGLCSLQIHYRAGAFWNLGPRTFAASAPAPAGPHVALELATEATVLR